jgi:hypothetical protein
LEGEYSGCVRIEMKVYRDQSIEVVEVEKEGVM